MAAAADHAFPPSSSPPVINSGDSQIIHQQQKPNNSPPSTPEKENTEEEDVDMSSSIPIRATQPVVQVADTQPEPQKNVEPTKDADNNSLEEINANPLKTDVPAVEEFDNNPHDPLPHLDWDDFEIRYEEAVNKARLDEQALLNEFSALVQVRQDLILFSSTESYSYSISVYGQWQHHRMMKSDLRRGKLSLFLQLPEYTNQISESKPADYMLSIQKSPWRKKRCIVCDLQPPFIFHY